MFSVAALIFLIAESSFAGKICLRDNFGGFWELKGGRIDKKTYTVKMIIPGVCVVGGYADAVRETSNILFVSLFNSHDTAGQCVPVLFSATTNLLFEGNGKFDTFANGTINGTFSLENIKCSDLPEEAPVNLPKTSTHPVVRKQ
jgi:hypothetical protein